MSEAHKNDLEIEAMYLVAAAYAPLDEVTRKRVHKWAEIRFDTSRDSLLDAIIDGTKRFEELAGKLSAAGIACSCGHEFRAHAPIELDCRRDGCDCAGFVSVGLSS